MLRCEPQEFRVTNGRSHGCHHRRRDEDGVDQHFRALGYPWLSFSLLPFRQPRCPFIGDEQFHLLDGDLIESGEAFGLGQGLPKKQGVEVFEV